MVRLGMMKWARGQPLVALAVCLLSVLLSPCIIITSRAAEAPLTPVHVAFLTDCTKYSDWQSLGMIFSFKMSGQPGTVTRVMCCSEEDRKKYPQDLLQEVETHIAPSYTKHPVTGDEYPAYNKPEAVIDWLQHVTPEEQYILVLDSDMILRRPFVVEVMQPKPGLAIGATYTYMIGVNNELAMRHVPEILPRNDTLAGPLGRRGDQVGGFFFIDRDDLKRMSTLWLKYTEDVRADPMAYKYAGDSYATQPGDKPWISEMYGYAFGAAKADVWHKWDGSSMIYPGYNPDGAIPKLLHNGLLIEVNGYKFDKAWHTDFDVTKCPPWDLSDPKNVKEGLFPHPPRPFTLSSKDNVLQYHTDLIAIEAIATMNAAFCDYHLRHCPPSKQLLDQCKMVFDIYTEVTAEVRRLEKTFDCMDFHAECQEWSQAGECKNNPEYMERSCRKACNKCKTKPDLGEDLEPQGTDFEKNLYTLAIMLAGAKAIEPVAGEAGAVVLHNTGQHHADMPKLTAEEQARIKAAVEQLVKERRETATVMANQATAQVSASSGVTRKDLVVRCYRMHLPLEEIKACMAAAKDMKAYQGPIHLVFPPFSSVKDTTSPGTSEPAADGTSEASHTTLETMATGSPVPSAVSGSDSLSRLHMAAGVNIRALHAMPLPTLLALIVGCLLVVTAVLLLCLPGVVRLRRRAKSRSRLE